MVGSANNDGLITNVRAENGAVVISVSGEIDIATCAQLRDAIEPHLGPSQTIVLDLSGVQFMDSSSLSVLVQARGALTADGGSLMLRNPSTAARRVLSITQLEDLLVEQRGDSET